jgi:hypothetical protein
MAVTRQVTIDGQTLETLARLAGEFVELPDDILVEAGVGIDARQFFRKLRSLGRIEPAAKIELEIRDEPGDEPPTSAAHIVFSKDEYLKFLELINRVVGFRGERELYLRTGRYREEIASAVAFLPRLDPTDS